MRPTLSQKASIISRKTDAGNRTGLGATSAVTRSGRETLAIKLIENGAGAVAAAVDPAWVVSLVDLLELVTSRVISAGVMPGSGLKNAKHISEASVV